MDCIDELNIYSTMLRKWDYLNDNLKIMSHYHSNNLKIGKLGYCSDFTFCDAQSYKR